MNISGIFLCKKLFLKIGFETIIKKNEKLEIKLTGVQTAVILVQKSHWATKGEVLVTNK